MLNHKNNAGSSNEGMETAMKALQNGQCLKKILVEVYLTLLLVSCLALYCMNASESADYRVTACTVTVS